MSICKAEIKRFGIHVSSSCVLKFSIRQKKLNRKIKMEQNLNSLFQLNFKVILKPHENKFSRIAF